MADAIPENVEKDEFIVVTFPPSVPFVQRSFPTLEKAHTYAQGREWNPLLVHKHTSITVKILEI